MIRLVRLTLLAMVVIGVGTLVLGSFSAQKPAPTGGSPYLSALSDLSVKPAEAVPCNHMECFFVDRGGTHHDEWTCIESPGLHCAIPGNGMPPGGLECTNLICP